MQKTFFVMALMLAGAACQANAATEYPIGAVKTVNNMDIAPNYLTGVMMETMTGMKMDKDAVHLEADIHAGHGEPHGFAPGNWIPYLTVTYTIAKTEGGFSKTGVLLPMTAGDGPHYANDVTLAGPGAYRVTYHIEPPSRAGFLRHVDKETGVPAWWQAFDVQWDFTYPAKPKAE
jgi:uncharacterized protein involved in high-affinity Fe2+ transport